MSTATLPPITPLTKKDFQTDQEVRWCPGCGDYAILSRRAVRLPRTRNQARELRRDFGNRLLQPLSVLHEHVRLSHDSRTRAGGCYRT